MKITRTVSCLYLHRGVIDVGDIVFSLFVIALISIIVMCIISIIVTYCMNRDILFDEGIIFNLFKVCRMLEFIASLIVLTIMVLGICQFILYILDLIVGML